MMIGLVMGSSPAQAQINVLSNPGAELGFTGWTIYNNAGYNFGIVQNIGSGATIPPRSGTNAFFIFGDYNTPTEYNGMYQITSAHAGQVFTADGWVYQLGTDSFNTANDGNNAFLEVTFLDSSSTVLARYRSASITNGSPTDAWIDMQVTNQLDPNTYAVTNAVTTLVAPANTFQVEYNLVFNLVADAGGSTYWDDLSLLTTAPPPPYITNVAPAVIQATNRNMTFTAVAQSGTITNIQLTVTAVTGLVNPTTNTTIYTTPSTNFTVSGLNTASANVSFPLATNTAYTVVIVATDSNQGNAVANASFDTIQPVLLWEAEDFNYNSGQFIDTTPDGGTALYAGLVGTQGIDENKAAGTGQPHFYRPDDAVSIQSAGELPREKFIVGLAGGNTNSIDEEVGYNSPGDWLNYTRTFPAGDYNVFARLATVGSGTQISLGSVGGDTTSTSQTVTNLGTFSFTDSGWNTYYYVPLEDTFGNVVTVHLTGKETLRATIASGGNPNINFYMIVPSTGSPKPALVSSYPTGTRPFEPTNHFSFTIGPAAGSPINSSGIHLKLNGADVTTQLSITAGSGNTWTASIPVSSNKIYSAVVSVTNTTSLSSQFNINFDTFSQTNFMVECEDFDFNSGEFIDNPEPTGDTTANGGILAANSYYGFPEGNAANYSVYGVDITTQGTLDGASHAYRPSDDCGTEHCGDFLRQKFVDAGVALNDTNITDFDIGWWNTGWWLNYTRTYPSGTYNVYARFAGGNGAFSGTTLALVTGGTGTSSQTTTNLGSFADPNASGWQTWHWVPMLDTNGNLATVTLGGVSTLKLTSGGNLNANFFMLTPAVAVAAPVSLSVKFTGGQPSVSFTSQNGFTYTLQYKNNLTDASWTPVTGTSSVSGDGTVKTLTDTGTGQATQRYYRVQIQ